MRDKALLERVKALLNRADLEVGGRKQTRDGVVIDSVLFKGARLENDGTAVLFEGPVPIIRARDPRMSRDVVAVRPVQSSDGAMRDWWVLMRPLVDPPRCEGDFMEFLQPDGSWMGVDAASARRFANETEALAHRDSHFPAIGAA